MPSAPRAPSLGALLLLIVGVVLLLTGGEDGGGDGPAGGENGKQGGGRRAAVVTRVVDGDTVEVQLGGVEEDVRYIGVDTPESVAPGQPVECFGKDASEFNRNLVEGERVRLRYGAERRDQYGRLLAYVYLGDEFVNAELVRRGYARTLTIAPNDDFEGLFARLQQQAANAGRGLWATCP